MAQYRILVFCKGCGRTHPANATVVLDDGPTEKRTVADAYSNKPLPLELVKMLKKRHPVPRIGDTGDARKHQRSVLGADRLTGYVVSASRIADRRMILAGYRLADLLMR